MTQGPETAQSPKTKDQRLKTSSTSSSSSAEVFSPTRRSSRLSWRSFATPAADSRLLIVPGGGPFADAVRRVDRDLGSL